MLLTNVSDTDVFLSKYMNVAACEIIEDSNVCLLSEVDPGIVRDMMFNDVEHYISDDTWVNLQRIV